jgi:hypothetical protein
MEAHFLIANKKKRLFYEIQKPGFCLQPVSKFSKTLMLSLRRDFKLEST